MAGERIQYAVEATDETGEAAESVERRFSETFRRIGQAALQVGGQLLVGLEDATNRAQQTFRRLRIATGDIDAATESQLSDLLGLGLPEDAVIDAIAAVQGTGGQLGVAGGAPDLTRTLAAVGVAGGDPLRAAQAAAGFGLRGDSEVAAAIETATVVGAQQGINPEVLFEGLRQYGPVLNAFGLNFLEAAALIVDLQQQGVDISRVSPALNIFIRNASRAGVSPRAAGQLAVEQLRAASDVDAPAIGQELFGAEGGLRLTTAIRSGAVGFGEELQFDAAGLARAPSLLALTAPTDRERFEGLLAEAQTDPNIIRRLFGGVAGGVGQVPVVGPAFGGGLGAALRIAQGDEAQLTLGGTALDALIDIANNTDELPALAQEVALLRSQQGFERRAGAYREARRRAVRRQTDG